MAKTKRKADPVEKAVLEINEKGSGEAPRKRRTARVAPAPGSPILWTNLPMVMARWNLDEAQATEALLATIGPMPEGEKYIRKHCPHVLENLEGAAKSVPSAPSRPVAAQDAETQDMTHEEDEPSEEDFDCRTRPEEVKDGPEDEESSEEEEPTEDKPMADPAADAPVPSRLGMLANALRIEILLFSVTQYGCRCWLLLGISCLLADLSSV